MRPVTHALAIEGLHHAHRAPEQGSDVPVLSLPTLLLAPGDRLLVQGESGSGKTTLLHLIAGILPVQKGSLRVAGTELRGMGEGQRDALRARHIGYLFQTFNLLPSLSALENVAVALTFQGVGTGAARRQAREGLDRVGLSTRRHHRPHQLSVGQQQRVAIARAVIGTPTLVLADEPTSSLDPARAADCLALLEGFAEEQGAALLIVTHDPALNDRYEQKLLLEAPVDERAEEAHA